MSATLWDLANRVPQPVLEKSATSGRALTLREWSRWKSHERYALYKTAVSRNEPETFYAVLAELRERVS